MPPVLRFTNPKLIAIPNGGDSPPVSVPPLRSLANFLLFVAVFINAFETPSVGSSVEAGP